MNMEDVDNQSTMNGIRFDLTVGELFALNQFPFFWSTDLLRKNLVIALFDQHTQAKQAVKELQNDGARRKVLLARSDAAAGELRQSLESNLSLSSTFISPSYQAAIGLLLSRRARWSEDSRRVAPRPPS